MIERTRAERRARLLATLQRTDPQLENEMKRLRIAEEKRTSIRRLRTASQHFRDAANLLTELGNFRDAIKYHDKGRKIAKEFLAKRIKRCTDPTVAAERCSAEIARIARAGRQH